MASRTVTVRARALKDATTNFISIVDKGANRLPIRQLKNEDTSMFNISNLFATKKQEVTPEALGLIVPAAQAEAYVAGMKAEGYADVFVMDCESDDVKFLALKEDATLDDTFKLNLGDRAVVVDNEQKMLKDWGMDEDQSFAENVAANGFYANLRVASDTLISGIYNAMEEDSPEVGDTRTAINTLLQDYTAYVNGLVANVPELAFKLEKVQPVEVEEAISTEQKSEESEGTSEAATEEANPQQGEVVVTDTTEAATEGNPESEAANAPEEGTEEVGETGAPAESGQKSENVQLTAILEKLGSLGEVVEGMKSEMDNMRETVKTQTDTLQDVTETVQKTEKKAQKAIDASHGTVVDTEDGHANTQKSEGYTPTFRASNIESA